MKNVHGDLLLMKDLSKEEKIKAALTDFSPLGGSPTAVQTMLTYNHPRYSKQLLIDTLGRHGALGIVSASTQQMFSPIFTMLLALIWSPPIHEKRYLALRLTSFTIRI